MLDGVERLTAEEMDERRQQNMAYEYLCHLEEAKRLDGLVGRWSVNYEMAMRASHDRHFTIGQTVV